jgi:hypothetical protein
MAGRADLLRQLESFVLEEISGVGSAAPFAAVERARVASLLTEPGEVAGLDAALSMLGEVIAVLAHELTFGQRQSVIRAVRRMFDDAVDGEPPRPDDRN